MDKKQQREEIKAAKKRYKETGAIVDFMRYDYLKNGVSAFNPENALPD